jgi:hypothetical protein
MNPENDLCVLNQVPQLAEQAKRKLRRQIDEQQIGLMLLKLFAEIVGLRATGDEFKIACLGEEHAQAFRQ